VSFIVLFLTKVACYFRLEQRFGLVQFTVGVMLNSLILSLPENKNYTDVLKTDYLIIKVNTEKPMSLSKFNG
jgi:hypothetical protein